MKCVSFTLPVTWSQETVELGGRELKIKVAHFRLAYSRKMFVVAYLRETQEMVMDAHNQAFAFYGGPLQMVSATAPAPALLYLLYPCSRMTTLKRLLIRFLWVKSVSLIAVLWH